MYALVDSQTYYLDNLEIYTSIQPEEPYRVNNKLSDVVLLNEPIY